MACCFQDFQLNSMEEVAAAAAAVEEEDTPLGAVHMVQDQVEAYPYVPSCGGVAKWLQTNREQVTTFAITYKNGLKVKHKLDVLLNYG